jgi:hypothetical protein
VKTWVSQKRTITSALVCVLLFTPVAANADVVSIISLLTTITSTLKSDVGQVLSHIESINSSLRNLQQQTLWPVSLINQARDEASRIRAQLSSLAGQIHSLGTSSAILAGPKQLEAVLRGRRSSGLNQLSGLYSQIYQPLPSATQATSEQRTLVDADDALALSGLKTATVSDEVSKRILSVADGLEQQAALSAPGSASILTAQAQATDLQNQAMFHHLLAAELRAEAARLAHANALRKQSANSNRELRLNIQQALTRSK